MKRVLSFVVFFGVLSVTLSESRFDEYQWTKASWNDFKLDRPRDRWRIEDSPLVSQQLEQLRSKQCDFTSARGPEDQSIKVEDPVEIDSEWLNALIDTVNAGTAVFGGVCDSVVEGAWDTLVDEIQDDVLASPERVRMVLDDACVDAVAEVVRKFSLIREGSAGGRILWKIQRRDEDSEASNAEVDAVEQVCERFLHQRRSQIVRALVKETKNYDTVLRGLLEWQLEEARGQKGEARMLEELCEDIHPNCENWADNGECVVNPSYMLKYCRISCGVCEGEPTFAKIGAFSLCDHSIDELDKASGNALTDLQDELCPVAPSMPEQVAEPIQIINFAPVLQGNEIKDVTRALFIELKDKCVRLSRGWWTYEVCFFSAIRQIHYDAEREMDSNLIGTFTEQRTVHFHPLLLQRESMDKLGLMGEKRPYILQTYEEGDECSAGTPRGAAIRVMCSDGLKQTPIPPNAIGMAIDEPDPCHYMLHLFVPLLCHYPEYSVFPTDEQKD